MKTILLTIFVILTWYSNAQIPKDKQLHYFAGLGISTIGGVTLFKITNSAGISISGGMGLAAIAGAGKEYIYDKQMHRGVPSVADFGWTCWGGLIGGICVSVGIDLHRKKQEKIREFTTY